jgi:hypothetical protein
VSGPKMALGRSFSDVRREAAGGRIREENSSYGKSNPAGVEEVVSEVSRVIGYYHLRRLKGKRYRPIRSPRDIALKNVQHKHKRE